MKTYEDILGEFDELYEQYSDGKWHVDAMKCIAALGQLTEEIKAGLAAMNVDGDKGLELIRLYIIGAIAADNKYSEEELDFCKLLLGKVFSSEEDLQKLDVEHLQNVLDDVVDMIGYGSDELKEKIVLASMIVCGIDGKISRKERKWLELLLKEA